MIKKEIVDSISEKLNMTKKDVSLIINAFLDETKESLKQEEKVVLSNFGVFEVKTVKPYPRFHPLTGETVMVKNTKKIVFRPSDSLKRHINGERHDG